MERHTVTIAGSTFVLAQGKDLGGIMAAIVAAARAGGDFVELIVFGNERISALVTPGVSVMFRSQQVEADDRDTGDTDYPFTNFDAYETAFPDL